MSFSDVIDFITLQPSDIVSAQTISSVGFMGDTYVFTSPSLGALSIVVEWFSKGIGGAFGVLDLPFFLALLLIFAYSFLFILTLRFLISVISGFVT